MITNYLGIASIDSLRITLDLHFIEVLNTNLLDHTIKQTVNTVTGEITNEKPIKSNSLKHEYIDYNIHFIIDKSFGLPKLLILANSKLLESDYMQGISMSNIEQVYTKLMEAKVFSISFEDFIKYATWSDADIKRDNKIESIELYSEGTRQLENATIPQRSKNKGANRFNKEGNKGIEWNNRTKSSFKFPFLKIYHKGLESKHGDHPEFFKNYLNLDEIKDVFRVEATIKNFSGVGVKFGIEDNSLVSLLKLNTEQLNAILTHSLTTNLEQRIKKVIRNKDTDITPQQHKDLRSLTFMLLHNQSIETAINYLIEEIPSAVSKSRSKKQLFELYESEIKGQDYEVKARGLNSFFDSLEWI